MLDDEAQALQPDAPVVETRSPRGLRGAPDCAGCATRPLCPLASEPMLFVALAPRIREQRVAAGTLLKKQGELAPQMTVIKMGTVYLCRDAGSDGPRPLAIAGRGFMLGMCSYLGQPNQLGGVAASAARVCTVATQDLVRAVRAAPPTQSGMYKLVAGNYALLARWAEAIGARTIPSGVAAAILLLAEQQGSTRFVLPSHTALAELLGTTRESVARALGLLEDGGCLQRTAGRRCELRPQALRDWIAQH